LSAPIAGSAKVTPTPIRRVIRSTSGSGEWRGNVLPIKFPRGIKPIFRPSMKNISPRMTAKRPAVTMPGSRSRWSRMRNLKAMRYAARGTTARTCSIRRLET